MCYSWYVTPDIDNEFSKYLVASGKRHLTAVKFVFGYVKKHPNDMIVVDPNDPKIR